VNFSRTTKQTNGLTKVDWFGFTASLVIFAAAILFARSAAELPTSSLMFVAACSMVWLPGRPETEDAAVLIWGRAIRRAFGRASAILRMTAVVAVDGLQKMFIVVGVDVQELNCTVTSFVYRNVPS
jgi:hypothetical protein